MARKKPLPGDGRTRSLHWDSYRSWVDPRTQSYVLFGGEHADQDEPGFSAASRAWCGYFREGVPFRFEQYGVMFDCPPGYVNAMLRGTTATFCVTAPPRDVMVFPNVNSRWMFPDDLCEVRELRSDVCPPQGMNLVDLSTSVHQPLLLPPHLGFAVRLDFAQGALDAIWAAQQRQEKIKITYLMWGVLNEPVPIPK